MALKVSSSDMSAHGTRRVNKHKQTARRLSTPWSLRQWVADYGSKRLCNSLIGTTEEQFRFCLPRYEWTSSWLASRTGIEPTSPREGCERGRIM